MSLELATPANSSLKLSFFDHTNPPTEPQRRKYKAELQCNLACLKNILSWTGSVNMI